MMSTKPHPCLRGCQIGEQLGKRVVCFSGECQLHGRPRPNMKVWIKVSSENRASGAWFYDLETAKQHAKRWEMLIPVEFPDWPNVRNDNRPTDDAA